MFCVKCGKQIQESSNYCCYCGTKNLKGNIVSSTSNYSRKKGKSLLEKADNYTVIDIETTGTYVTDCEVIELSAIRVRDNQPIEKYTTLVNPKENIPEEIIELTGITNEMVKDAPTLSECLESFLDFIGDDILLGHNIVAFDSNILYDEAEFYLERIVSNDMIDTLRFSRHCDIDVPNHKLKTLQDYFGVVNDAQHRALSDCLATHECYQKMKSLIKIKQKKPYCGIADSTKNLIALKELLSDASLDGKITKSEVFSLKSWLDSNQNLAGNYPFDIVFKSIEKVLEDGVLEQEELEELFDIFQEVLDPVNAVAKCDDSHIDFSEKKICLSGEFEFFSSKAEVESLLIAKGAEIKKSVVKSLDYLIVGGKGSDAWSSGNYGTKVKKALEWNEKGSAIQILREEDFKKIISEE